MEIGGDGKDDRPQVTLKAPIIYHVRHGVVDMLGLASLANLGQIFSQRTRLTSTSKLLRGLFLLAWL